MNTLARSLWSCAVPLHHCSPKRLRLAVANEEALAASASRYQCSGHDGAHMQTSPQPRDPQVSDLRRSPPSLWPTPCGLPRRAASMCARTQQESLIIHTGGSGGGNRCASKICKPCSSKTAARKVTSGHEPVAAYLCPGLVLGPGRCIVICISRDADRTRAGRLVLRKSAQGH
ncbi:MAG: hypothetical protein ACI8W7_003008 [Gammaproteobacteria bacterium]